ncbi:J domain-containing protein [Hydrogenophaga sp. 2FB]|uniref:J domain-containing protein n=1 Tax=Hydrogenophaga sp. 2FB TaxID=2502187 RepID=UPI0010F56DAE|nr:J domain-containing protein [Hydrogenophaga sp. 2FB]
MTTRAPHGRNLLLKLLDFERSPGRYPVALREPRPLFDHIDSVMLIAAGRPVEGLRVAPANEHELNRAARFFVRTVMLRPGADPLTLLGLSPGFEPEQLREHYRLMIRLTHPDFVAQGERWPADAATRINLAKDLLSAPRKPTGHTAAPRASVDAAPVAMASAPMRPRPLLPKPATGAHDDTARAGGWSVRTKLAWIGMGVALMAGVLLLSGARSTDGFLDVRPVPPAQDLVAPPPRGTPALSPRAPPGVPLKEEVHEP